MRTTHPTRRGRRRMPAAAAAFTLSLALSSCSMPGSSSGAETPAAAADDRFDLSGTTVRLGTAQPQTLTIGTSYAVDLLKDWGAQVQVEELTNLSGLEAIVADRIDVASRSSDELIVGTAEGVEVTAIGAPVSRMHYALMATEGIGTVAELRGKDIAISGPGGYDTVLIRHLLETEGLDPDRDVTLVPIGGSSERTAAALSGQADAAMVFIDNWTDLREEGAPLQLVGYVEDLLPGLSARTYFAGTDYVQQNEELATAIACANLEANRWINSDKQKFVDYTMEHVRGANEDAVAAFWDVAQDLELYPTDPQQLLPADTYVETAKLLRQSEVVSEQINPEQFIDNGPLQKAADMGCGQPG